MIIVEPQIRDLLDKYHYSTKDTCFGPILILQCIILSLRYLKGTILLALYNLEVLLLVAN